MDHSDHRNRSRLPPLNAVRAFEAAARYLNLATAAEELCVTRAAVGQQVRLLEDVLGIQLFHRGPSGLVLTERGRDYYVAVSSAIGILADATGSLRGEDTNQSLRIVAQPNFAIKWLAPRLGQFHAKYPELTLTVSAGSVRFDFADQQADVAIVYGKDFANVRAHRLFASSIVPLCVPALAQRLRHPGDLKPEWLLRAKYLPDEWPAWLDAAGLPALDWQSGPMFDSALLAVEAAKGGLGVALGQRQLVEREIASGELVVPLDISVGSPMAWTLIYPVGAEWMPKVVVFKQWLLDEAMRQG